jgi:hypothetical protein
LVSHLILTQVKIGSFVLVKVYSWWYPKRIKLGCSGDVQKYLWYLPNTSFKGLPLIQVVISCCTSKVLCYYFYYVGLIVFLCVVLLLLSHWCYHSCNVMLLGRYLLANLVVILFTLVLLLFPLLVQSFPPSCHVD